MARRCWSCAIWFAPCEWFNLENRIQKWRIIFQCESLQLSWETVMRHDYQPEFFKEQFAEREDLFRAFFNLPLVGAAISTRSKNWIAVNDRACQILGYPREVLYEKSWVEITHPDDLENCLSHFQLWLSGEINELLD